MKIEIKKFKDVNRAPYNPRVELKAGMPEYEKLKKSIETFGHVLPMVYNQKSGTLVGGHQTMTVLKDLGKTEAEMSIVDLNEVEEKALNIGLNKISGEWNNDKLIGILNELIEIPDFDIDLTGFTLDEIGEIDLQLPTPEVEEDDFDADKAIGEIDEPITKRGDVILLGKNRLVCGDSTDADDVKKLMDGKKADLILTDPPYGIDVVQGNQVGGGGIVPSSTYEKIVGDETTETAQDFYNLITTMGFKNVIMWGGNYFTDFLPPSPCWIIWDKENTGNFADVEMAWTSFEKGAKLYKWLWNGLSRKGDRKSELISRVHPTQKPVGLHVNILNDFTDINNIIGDFFSGGGTILIAAEQTNRICYGMELSEKYCDVIVHRWEEFTKKKAVRL